MNDATNTALHSLLSRLQDKTREGDRAQLEMKLWEDLSWMPGYLHRRSASATDEQIAEACKKLVARLVRGEVPYAGNRGEKSARALLRTAGFRRLLDVLRRDAAREARLANQSAVEAHEPEDDAWARQVACSRVMSALRTWVQDAPASKVQKVELALEARLTPATGFEHAKRAGWFDEESASEDEKRKARNRAYTQRRRGWAIVMDVLETRIESGAVAREDARVFLGECGKGCGCAKTKSKQASCWVCETSQNEERNAES